MKNTDRYNELIVEREQILYDLEYAQSLKLLNVEEFVDLKLRLAEVEEELKDIEKEDIPTEFYILTKEVYDKINDDVYYITLGEYMNDEEALEAYKEEQLFLLSEFGESYAVSEEPGVFKIEDDEAQAVLLLIKVEAE